MLHKVRYQIHFGPGGRRSILSAWPALEISDAMAAFSHHAFLKTNHNMVFSDLQGKYTIIIEKVHNYY